MFVGTGEKPHLVPRLKFLSGMLLVGPPPKIHPMLNHAPPHSPSVSSSQSASAERSPDPPRAAPPHTPLPSPRRTSHTGPSTRNTSSSRAVDRNRGIPDPFHKILH